MRGQTAKTPEAIARAQELRDRGWTLKQIAAEFGLKHQTVHSWLSDPDGSKLKARKDSYGGICSECGGPTTGCNGPARAPTHCLDCIRWEPDEILSAIRAWTERHGGRPPCDDDCIGDRSLPSARSAARVFGSWSHAIAAAGYKPRADKRPETWDAILAAVKSGEAVADVAERFGVGTRAIYMRFYQRGMRVSEVRRGVAA